MIQTPINIITSLAPWVQETKWDTLAVPRRLLENDNNRRIKINQILQNDSSIETITEAQFLSTVKHLLEAHKVIKTQLESAQEIHSYALLTIGICVVIIVFFICVCMCVRFNRQQPIQAFHLPMENM